MTRISANHSPRSGRGGRVAPVAEHQALDVRVLDGVLDINADRSTRFVKIKNNPLRHFIALRAGTLCEVDIQGIGLRVVGAPHGRNLSAGESIVARYTVFEGDGAQESVLGLDSALVVVDVWG